MASSNEMQISLSLVHQQAAAFFGKFKRADDNYSRAKLNYCGYDSTSKWWEADMEFVQKFTPLDFQVKNFTPSILPNFNSFSKKKTQKMSENGEIYTAGKNFTLPPALTGWTNSTSDPLLLLHVKCESPVKSFSTKFSLLLTFKRKKG